MKNNPSLLENIPRLAKYTKKAVKKVRVNDKEKFERERERVNTLITLKMCNSYQTDKIRI